MKDKVLAAMEAAQSAQYYSRLNICKCGGAMQKVSCYTKRCLVYECRVCGRRGHHAPKPSDCIAAYG